VLLIAQGPNCSTVKIRELAFRLTVFKMGAEQIALYTNIEHYSREMRQLSIKWLAT